MAEPRFNMRLRKSAQKEYEKLDYAVASVVDKSLEELELWADEVGRPLGKKRNVNLTGCKEIKLCDARIRIVFTVTNRIVQALQVVVVIAIQDRDDDYVIQLVGE